MSDYDIPRSSAEGFLTLLALRGIGSHAAFRLASRFETLHQLRQAARDDWAALVSAAAAPTLADHRAWDEARGHASTILEKRRRSGSASASSR